METASKIPAGNIAIISGEVSGDLVGAELAKALLTCRPDLRLWGVGSNHMREAGVELLHNSGQWSAIGVMEALKLYPELRFRMFPSVLREISMRKPRAVVLIDFGAFNFKVARWCKSRRIPVTYYFPPGSWKRKGRINEEIGRVTDCVATPFPWSVQRLRSAGANAHFVGHPLLEIVKPTMSRAEFAERYRMEAGRPIIGLLPGSRSFEVEHNTPVMLDAAERIVSELPDAQFVFGAGSESSRKLIETVVSTTSGNAHGISQFTRELAETVTALDQERRRQAAPRMVTTEGLLVSLSDLDEARKRQRRASPMHHQLGRPPFVIAEGLTYDVMAHSDAIIVCSGTATLEAAIFGTPMVIIYRGSRLMELEFKIRRVRVEHIGLPNIIAGERIVPEFLQHDATPGALAESVLQVLRDPAKKAEVRRRLREVTETLGGPGASLRTAKLVLDTAGLQ